MSKEIIIPDTLEEGLARMDEISEILQEYNIAILNNQTTKLNDDEINDLQEEYDILQDYFSQKRFKKQIKEQTEASMDDQSSKEQSKFVKFLNQVNPIIWFYLLVVLVFSEYFFIKIIGYEVLTKTLIDWQWIVGISKTALWIDVFLLVLFYPICLFILSVILFFIFRKGMNHLVMKYVLMIQAVILFVSLVFVYIFCAKEYFEELEQWRLYYEFFGTEA